MIALWSFVACLEYDPRCTRELPGAYESVPCTGVCINEIMADNREFVTDTADLSEALTEEATEDWVELYNSGDGDVNIGDLMLERDDSGYQRSTLPKGHLVPGGHILLVASAERQRGDRTLEFDLNSDWGTLRLLTVEGECVIDRLYYPEQDPGFSYARGPEDGGPLWGSTDDPTPHGPPARLYDTGAQPTGTTP